MSADTNDKFNYAQFKLALNKALDRIGASNGHQFRNTWLGGDNAGVQRAMLLHEYSVTSIAESYFKKRRDTAKKELMSHINSDDDLTKAIKHVTPGASAVIVQSPIGMLTLKVNNPVERIDVDAFIVALRLKGVDQHVISAAKVEATRQNKPAEMWEVVAPLT